MTSRLRAVIAEKLQNFTHIRNVYNELRVPTKKKQSCQPTLEWILPMNAAQQVELLSALQIMKLDADCFEGVEVKPPNVQGMRCVEFKVQPDAFLVDLLKSENVTPPRAINHPAERVVVEFSSPNIAKPFHFGHLRSTIIGNVIANLYTQSGYATTKMNYLGDWGTQFGLLALGVQMLHIDDEQMREKPIKSLYKAYVEANKAAALDTTVWEQACKLFTELEKNEMNTTLREQWITYRKYTIDELTRVYARLGVQFDHYEWESKYSQSQITEVLQRLRAANILMRDADGREIIRIDKRNVPIMKSDGSTLYLARDIAALLERKERFQFNRIIYVVDNSQTDHFNSLFRTTSALSRNLPLEQMTHVKFGRVHGMSTRRGEAIFLEDVLNEARDAMREKRQNRITTRNNANYDDDEVCDILGISAVIVNDLKQRRQRDYEFCWEKALQNNGDTGIKLQYTHCRLHSLLENQNLADIDLAAIMPSWQFLPEPQAAALIFEIARFEQTVWQAKEQHEACILVNYLFSLCNTTSRALKQLQVKTAPNRLTQANRLLLFNAAKRTLCQGMKILGIRPLNQM